MIAEDVHCLDVSTCEVLAFASRRLGADAVGLLVTARESELGDNPLAAAGLAELRLGPLGPAASAALLDVGAALDPHVRRRVLEAAAGNPLALVELPLTAVQGGGGLDGWIPLTRRLEQAFASRLPGLPAVTFTALLAAGLNDGDALAEVLAAASLVAGAGVPVADLAAAQAVGLAEVDGRAVRFRHPLVRSAVCEAAAVPVAPDHQQPPVPDLPEARHHLASRARRGRDRPPSPRVGHRGL